MRIEMCLLCGSCLASPDRRSPGGYICTRCGNRWSASRPQLSGGFMLAVMIAALLLFVFSLFWYGS